MASVSDILWNILSGSQDRNIRFNDVRKLLDYFEFKCRVKGDHFIYFRDDIPEIINIQPAGSKAKAYQVKQVRDIILKHHLEIKK